PVYHLSLGKYNSKDEVEKQIENYRANWKPIRYRLTEIHILSKENPEKKYSDVYVVRKSIPLGGDPFNTYIPHFKPVPWPTTEADEERLKRTVWMKGLPSHVTPSDLVDALEKWGAVE